MWVESLECRATLTTPPLSSLLAMFASQVNPEFNNAATDFNNRLNSLFSSEVTPEFTGLSANFMTTNSDVNSIIFDATSSMQGSFTSTFNALAPEVGQVDNYIYGAVPSVSAMTFPLAGATIMSSPPMPGMPDMPVFVNGDGFMFTYTPGLGVRNGMINKETITNILTTSTKTRWKFDLMDGVRQKLEYEQAITSPTLNDNWAVRLDAATTPKVYIRRGYSNGPASFSADANIDPLGLQTANLSGGWSTDSVNGAFSVNKMSNSAYFVQAKVGLNSFDGTDWKPFGVVGHVRTIDGVTNVSGIRFEHANGKIFFGRGVFTPAGVGLTKTYWTTQAVYQLNGSTDWKMIGQWIPDGGPVIGGSEIQTSANFSHPLLNNFKPKFRVGVYYTTHPFTGMPTATDYGSIPPLHEGFNLWISTPVGKW